MLGFSGRTGRATFAVVGTLCWFSVPLMLSMKPLIDQLSGMEANAAVLAGNAMAIAAIAWSGLAAVAWLLVTVRRLRDAGLHLAWTGLAVVLGFMNAPPTLIDPLAWGQRPLMPVATVLCMLWVVALSLLPSRDRVRVEPAASAAPFRGTPGPVAPRKQFGLR